ncbi:hypothetical protein V6N12_050642 [Hibiscus sabdariffa]|uniref:Reverse transcriptase Ty1/copia-type domain-containing protein n=1 Tax=Hibiscus sabdariffa TaxID=183260 RepID=A0ABR2GD05_9ROSI
MENVSIATSLVIGRETALSILKKSRKLKQSEHPSQGLHMRRNLAKGDVDLRVGNGARVAALPIGTYVLSLPSERRISKLHKDGLLDPFVFGQMDVCESCLLGKMTKAPFNGKSERASDLLGLIHSDVCGPMNAQARGGFHYFITFTDDFSRYGYIYLMRHKSEALEMFKEFRNEVQNQHAAFTLNRVPSKSVQKTPHEMWTGKRPNMSFMKIWGCKAYVKHQMSTKLEPKSHKCTFVGYPKEAKGYYFYNHKENKVFVARTGVFLEKDFLSSKEDRRNIELEEVQQQQDTEPEVERFSQTVEENSTDLETRPLRRSTRERHEPERYGFLVTTHGDVILVDHDEPKTYQEAVSSPDSEKWLEAMRSEMDSMSDNQVWTLVEPPEGIKPIGCKWVFKKKTDMDGNVQTYKGRLVAKGYRRIHGIDYDETFSPVAMFKSIRILLAIAAFHDYEIWQMDVKTAFLNGKLEEDVYMTQPEGFVTPENAGKVCKLQRSIYRLKQASRSWNLRFNDAIKEFGFIRNEDEPCVYKKFSGSLVSFLILYVDDILIIGNDIPTLQSVKAWLSSCFSMKDLGEAAYILGVKTYRDR